MSCLCRWGDAYYMGLNSIELFDCFNQKIELDGSRVRLVVRIPVIIYIRSVGARHS